MRLATGLSIVITAASISLPALGRSPDDELRIYAVNVVKTTPFEKPFTGDGIYLGRGAVVTAAHVIGHWGFLKDPHVLIAGQDLPAKIVKEGSLEQIDLTLLSVDETSLPISLQLRRNPLCKQPPWVGENVIGVTPEKAQRYQVISPLQISPEFRKRFNTLINEAAGSGSGIFDADRRCLLGIMSRATTKFKYLREGSRIIVQPFGRAGYFIPASQIADFIPPEFRF